MNYQDIFFVIMLISLVSIFIIVIDIIFSFPSERKGIIIKKSAHVNYNGEKKIIKSDEYRLNILFASEFYLRNSYITVFDIESQERIDIKCNNEYWSVRKIGEKIIYNNYLGFLSGRVWFRLPICKTVSQMEK